MSIKVKALEWERGAVDWARPMPGMKYVACGTTPEGSWGWWLDGAPETQAVFSSENAAKAAAQADYERRILSALEPPPDMREAVEALEPFADAADEIERKYGEDTPDYQYQFPLLEMRQFRRARTALRSLTGAKP